jgi:protein SCO1
VNQTKDRAQTGAARRHTWLPLLLATCLATFAACGASRPGAPSQNLGAVLPPGHDAPPTSLVNQDGQHLTLRSFQGKYVMLAPFTTLCQDECPITTAAFQIIQRSVRSAGLADKVVFVEATLDPQRDSVARLHAYQTRFGADWQLLTGTDANITALWKYFGIFYQKVPEDDPPGTDWWTGKTLTYTIDHTNGFILIDPAGNERFITEDLPILHGQIAANLRRLLDHVGIQHLDNGIPGQSYTIPQALGALSWLVGRRIPLVTS